VIPQALKWVAAAVGIIIVVAVSVPLAINAMLGTVEFTDDSGLFETTPMEDPLPTPAPGELDDLDDGAEEEGDDEGEDAEDRETAEDAEVVTNGDEDDADDDDGQTYTVESGDTLYSIAEEVYGDGNRWSEIAEANGIDDQSGLTVGQELDIP